MRRPVRTWGFASLVAIVVGYALYDYASLEKNEQEKEKQSLLLDWPAAQVAEFVISGEKGEIHLKKGKDGWKILKPVVDAADSSAAEQFVDGLATEKSTGVAVEGESIRFDEFGLDAPKGSLLVFNQAGEKNQFQVGSRKNFEGDSFLRKNQDKKVLIASSTWFSKLEKSALDFRDKRLMRGPSSQVDEISFEKKSGSFTLVRKDKGWVLSSQPKWNLDQNRVRELLSMLNSTQAIEFIVDGEAQAEELEKWGLEKPKLKLRVRLKNGTNWVAQFAAGPDQVHRVKVSDPHAILKISPTDSDKFSQMNEIYFRDDSEPFQFQKEAAQVIGAQTAQGRRSLKRGDKEFSDLVNRLRNLSVYDFRENKKAEMPHQISIKDDKGKEIFVFQWGKPRSIQVNGESFSVVDAKTSLFPQHFQVLENDISSLALNHEAEPETEKKKENAK